jgi:hypothetical protein
MLRSRSLLLAAGLFALASIPAFAGVYAETPEPKLGFLAVLGVGAVVLAANKLKKR